MMPLLARNAGRWTSQSLLSKASPSILVSKSQATSISNNMTVMQGFTLPKSNSVAHRMLATSRKVVSKEERAALRAARKERATQAMQQEKGGAASSSTVAETSTAANARAYWVTRLGWWWYAGGLLVPTALTIWAMNDEDSPPAQFSKMIGLTDLITSFTDDYAKPAHAKLLPDWSQMPNVPHDIPPPHTLVLDLENTLVGSTWDRKYGWRHAKRPGVEKFLHDMAQYYEIVLYSPSHEGLAEPVVAALDKDGCIMHRLYREATHFHNGIHVKDLNSLNRNVKRIVVLDDDPSEVQFNPENLIRVKPYDDPTNREDNTLERITPFLIEIARDGHNDVPALLQQYQGMDADQIADEQDRRLARLKQQRQEIRERGLGFLASRSGPMEAPELPPSALPAGGANYSAAPQQLTAKAIAGSAPGPDTEAAGLVGFLNRRAKEKEEHQQRKMEKWTEVMMRKQKEREEKAKQNA